MRTTVGLVVGTSNVGTDGLADDVTLGVLDGRADGDKGLDGGD